MPLRLTDFIQRELNNQLGHRLRELGLGFTTKKEKTFKNVRFDNYAYSKKRGVFLNLGVRNGER